MVYAVIGTLPNSTKHEVPGMVAKRGLTNEANVLIPVCEKVV